MAQRVNDLGFQVGVRGAPSFPVDDGGAAGLSNLGSTFLKLSGALSEKADKSAAIRGADKGADASLKFDLAAPPPLTKGTDTESIAFDRALQDGYAKRLELATRQQAQKLATEYPLDAAGYTGAMVEWSKGMKKNMPSNIQPGFDLTVQTLAAPHVTAIAGVQRKQAEEGDKEVTALLAGQLLTDFRGYGRTLASATSPDQAATSLEAAKLSFSTMIGGLNSAVVGGRMDQRAAAAQLLNFKGDMNAAIVQGMFDGYKDKAGFLDAWQRGELRLPAVDIQQGADGKFEVAVKSDADPKVLLTPKQSGALRDYMNAAVDDIAQQRDRLRADFDRVGSKSVDAQLAAIARGDQSAYDALLKNPSAKAGDIDKARDYMRQGETPTDFRTYRQLETAVLQGHEFTDAQLQAAPLALADRNRLKDIQKAQSDYQAQPVYRDARDEIRLTVGGITQQVIAITGDEKGGTQKRQELAAKFEAQLASEVNRRRLAAVQAGRGFGIARSADGSVEWTYGNDSPVSFDPYTWVKQRIATVQERVKPTAEQQKSITTELQANNAKMGQLRLRGDSASREQVKTLADRNAELVKQQVSSDAFLDALFSELN